MKILNIYQYFNQLQPKSLSIQKSRREASPVEQYTIDYEYLAYFDPQKRKKNIYKRDFMQLFSEDTIWFLNKV